MGTENLSYAWYDEPALMHEMMEFYADFIIETSRPVLEQVEVDFFTLNEDIAMKGGPLMGPDAYRTFILPHLKRLVSFLKGYGIRHIAIDSDGDPTLLIPSFLEAGVNHGLADRTGVRCQPAKVAGSIRPGPASFRRGRQTDHCAGRRRHPPPPRRNDPPDRGRRLHPDGRSHRPPGYLLGPVPKIHGPETGPPGRRLLRADLSA